MAPAPRGSALVTGASRGLGAAIAQHLGDDSWPVAVNYRTGAGPAQQVADRICAHGGTAATFQGDVTDEASVADLIRRVAAALGPVEVLVVNASGPQPVTPIEELTWQAHLDQLAFFVKSPTLLVQATLSSMKARKRGRIIQIGSDSFTRALAGTSAYVAAKGAQLGLTRTWARELAPHGITVNLVAPGWIPVERHSDIPRAELERYVAETPLGRAGKPADVAGLVSFLASDAAAYITGEQIAVNGAHTLT